MSTATALTAAKVAAKEAKRLLSRVMHTDEWRIEGEIIPVREVSPGRWLVRVPRGNPLRLVHLATGRALVGAYSEMVTDWGSVPEWAQRLGAMLKMHLDPRDYEHAVFAHDMDYDAGWCWAVWHGHAVKVALTKRQADAKLFVMLECCRATVADGLAYHGGVTLGGGPAWRRCRREKSEWPELFQRSNGETDDGRP